MERNKRQYAVYIGRTLGLMAVGLLVLGACNLSFGSLRCQIYNEKGEWSPGCRSLPDNRPGNGGDIPGPADERKLPEKARIYNDVQPRWHRKRVAAEIQIRTIPGRLHCPQRQKNASAKILRPSIRAHVSFGLQKSALETDHKFEKTSRQQHPSPA